jgi:hypothetical protein
MKPIKKGSREAQLHVISEALEGLNSFLAHIRIKGKNAETKLMGRKLAKKITKKMEIL